MNELTPEEIKEDLKDVPTKRLLKWLDLTRKTNGCYELSRTKNSITVVYYEDLKKELATREHIPNKDERKKTRIKKQQAKQNR